jgi:hypothetical protein
MQSDTSSSVVGCLWTKENPPSSCRVKKAGAVYAQSADWGAEEAEGFILLYGMSSTLSARVNPKTAARWKKEP